jgi:endonuclease/exonuclease/phosphatase family metal-dependent hydrolase
MISMRSIRSSYSAIIAYSILFLFFFQLLADFIAAIYAIGLMGLNLPPEIACVLLLFSPVLLIFFRKSPSGKGVAFLAAWVLFSRCMEVMLDTRGRMFVSGLGVACFLVFLPALLCLQPRKLRSRELGISLGLGVTLSIFLRTLGSGVDLSNVGMFKAIGWLLALLAGACLLCTFSSGVEASQSSTSSDQAGRARIWKVICLSLGITAVFVLLYFAFTSPAVIARWTGASYLLILIVLLLALSGCVIGLAWKPALLARLKPGTLLAWNVLFVLCLTLTILAQQVHFPSTPAGYPFTPSLPPWQEVPLVLMLLLAPVILVDFTLFSREISIEKPSIRLIGGSFALGSLFLLVMIFAQVFTTVYDYIPVVGPLFRDKFWLVFLVSGLVLTLPTLLVQKTTFDHAEDVVKVKDGGQVDIALPVTAFIALIAIITLASGWLTTPRPSTPSEPETTNPRVLTYNIQQGYSQDGQISFNEQLALLRRMNPDVIGLQENDTARIANGNNDVVRYFADRLEMHSYYGPSTVAGTFGIALLSRYPIQNPHTYYMYSVGEQTAVIEAQIVIRGKIFNVYVTHLGNGGPIVQQEEVLQLVQGKDNLLLMGDFNFRPDTDQYRLTTSMLSEAWLLRWPQADASQDFDPADRIDYLFVSPGMKISESYYLTGPQSDHPALVIEIAR